MARAVRKRVRFVAREAKEPEWKAAHRAADRNLGKVAATFPVAVKQLRDTVDPDAVRVALERNDPGTAISAFQWDIWARLFDRLVTPRLAETMRASADAVGRATIVRKRHQTLEGVFDLTNPRAQRIAALIAAELVTRVDEVTRQAMREIIARAQAFGIPLREQAAELEQVLIQMAGLDSRRAATLRNFENRQIVRGVAPRIIERRVNELRDKLLLDRAKVIARHETMVAANAGQVELWDQAEEEGFLPVGLLREWITTPDDRICPICEPMDGQKRLRGDLFVSSFNGQTYERPPAHVLCRCALSLAES